MLLLRRIEEAIHTMEDGVGKEEQSRAGQSRERKSGE
jgi:hypothetical protein